MRDGTLDEWIVDEVLNLTCYAAPLNLRSGDVVLDIGMNIGAFSVLASLCGGGVIGYEPEKENYDIAILNMELNGFKGKFIQAGISDIKRNALLFLNGKKNKADHTMEKMRGREAIEVQCFGINEVLKEHKPNKIKMDCEGEEYKIILAVQDWINTEKMVFEWHRRILKDEKNKKFNAVMAALEKDFEVIAKRDGRGWTQKVKCERK